MDDFEGDAWIRRVEIRADRGRAHRLGIVCIAAARGFLRTIARGFGRSRAASAEPTWVPTAPERFRPTGSGAVRSALLMSRRWFHGAKWTGAFFALGLCAALVAPRSPRFALGAAMLVPLSIVNARRISGEAGTRAFESTTAAFWRPSPLLFTALTLALLTAIPVVPVLLQAPAVPSRSVAGRDPGGCIVADMDVRGDRTPGPRDLGLRAGLVRRVVHRRFCILIKREEVYAFRSSRRVRPLLLDEVDVPKTRKNRLGLRH